MSDLQTARAAAAERFEAIGARCLPEGWTVAYRKSLSGRCFTNRKHIDAPRPRTRKSLYIFLHECAHAHLHCGAANKRPRHVKEFEAETWAHEKMRENGVPVPRSMTQRAKEYVARKIRGAERRGAKKISAAARRFAKTEPAHV